MKVMQKGSVKIILFNPFKQTTIYSKNTTITTYGCIHNLPQIIEKYKKKQKQSNFNLNAFLELSYIGIRGNSSINAANTVEPTH